MHAARRPLRYPIMKLCTPESIPHSNSSAMASHHFYASWQCRMSLHAVILVRASKVDYDVIDGMV